MGPLTGLDDVERRKILLLPGLELRAMRFNIEVLGSNLYRVTAYLLSPVFLACSPRPLPPNTLDVCDIFSFASNPPSKSSHTLYLRPFFNLIRRYMKSVIETELLNAINITR
jgi:hypothetical protein